MRDLSLYKSNEDHRINKMLEGYAPLVKQVALHLIARLPASVELDDLIQVGMIGLLEADKNFDPGKGAQFETFARIRIRGAMIDELRRSSHLPRSLMTTIRDISSAKAELEQQLSRRPKDTEMAEFLGLSVEEYHKCIGVSHDAQTVSISEDEEGGEVALRFEGLSIPDQINQDEFQSALATEISQLSEREQLIFALYYNEEMNLKEIALVIGVSESRVCQIQKQAVVKLREGLCAHI